MHIARLTKKRPYHWKVEAVAACEDVQSGVLFLGAASAENAQRYADWCNSTFEGIPESPAAATRPLKASSSK
jgi:hypothetical protein